MWDYGADEFFSAPFHAAFHNNLEVQSIEFFFELLQIVENCGRTMSLLRSRSGFAFSEKKNAFSCRKKKYRLCYTFEVSLTKISGLKAATESWRITHETGMEHGHTPYAVLRFHNTCRLVGDDGR